MGRDLKSRPIRGWRLILDGKHGAAENMAIDEAMMRACAEGSVSPTVRIYDWSRPSISLGCLQRILRQAQDAGQAQDARQAQDAGERSSFDLDFCRSEGIEVVRRITGGRAVMHGCDVTFSIALREADLPDGCSSVLASHQWLMSGIVRGLGLLGIDAAIGGSESDTFRIPHSTFRDPTADCFAHIAECDVRVGPSKVVGSAQVRRFGAILEQGSIPYAPPPFDAARVFGGAPAALCLDADRSSIVEALVHGFSDLTSNQLEQSPLTPREMQIAAQLAGELYCADEWTIFGTGIDKQPNLP